MDKKAKRTRAKSSQGDRERGAIRLVPLRGEGKEPDRLRLIPRKGEGKEPDRIRLVPKRRSRRGS